MAEIGNQALAEFLRSRRDRLTPEMAGLPRVGRRRAPGLRREEVSSLAGVGLTWYTWLEQGRPINASAQVLLAVARALRLNVAEREHLLGLAGFVAKGGPERDVPVLAEAHRSLLAQLLPYPACVVDDRWDLFAYNRTYRHFWGDLTALPEEDWNCMLLMFTHAGWQEAFADHPEGAYSYVSRFRAAMVDHTDDPSWAELALRLRAQSPLFADVWSEHDVRVPEDRRWRLRAQHVGAVVVDTTNLALHDNRKVRLAALVPADDASLAAFARLDAMFAAEPTTTVRAGALSAHAAQSGPVGGDVQPIPAVADVAEHA